jgi:hypothetical protein
MIRTQVSLDEKDYRLAKKSAKERGISLAESAAFESLKAVDAVCGDGFGRCKLQPYD